MDLTKIDRAIDACLADRRQDMIRLLADWIRIPSVRGEAQPDAPYGAEVERMLQLAGKSAHALGLKTEMYHHRVCITHQNDLPRKLGILCHLDVVAADPTQWAAPPFNPQIRDGMLYGRGALDNKGPGAAALYAMAAVRAAGVPLRYDAGLYFGTNEETGMADFKSYLIDHALPPQVIVPDACFPVGVSERGRICLRGDTALHADAIESVCSGTSMNIIPDRATAVLRNIRTSQIDAVFAQIPEIRYERAESDGRVIVTIHGRSTHSAHPQEGVNAVTALTTGLAQLLPQEPVLAELATRFPHGAFAGEGFGLPTGAAALSLVQLEAADRRLTWAAEARVAPGYAASAMASRLQEFRTAPVEITQLNEPHAVDPNAPLVQQLQRIYTDMTGRANKPYDLDASTYAHLQPNAVVFGGVMPGDGSGGAHGANECYALNTLMLAARMFARTIVQICGVQDE